MKEGQDAGLQPCRRGVLDTQALIPFWKAVWPEERKGEASPSKSRAQASWLRPFHCSREWRTQGCRAGGSPEVRRLQGWAGLPSC